MNTNIIQLQEKIPFEKYQMAIRVLEAMDIKVLEQKEVNETVSLSYWQEKMLLERANIVSDKNSKNLEETHKIIDECFK